MKKIFALVGAVLILTILLTGCTSQPGTQAPATTAVPTEKPTEVTTAYCVPGFIIIPHRRDLAVVFVYEWKGRNGQCNWRPARYGPFQGRWDCDRLFRL